MKRLQSFYRNKTILITGAAGGIGRELAERLAACECDLILWDRNPDVLEEIKRELPEPGLVLLSGLDVTDDDRISEEAEQLIRAGFLPDIIICSAGIVKGKPFRELSAEEIAETLQINIEGTMLVTKAFLPEMIQRGSGQIVLLSSASGYVGHPNMSVYAASKWALIGWADSLRLELKGSGVSLTCVIPGYVDTGMFDGVVPPRFLPMLSKQKLVKKMMNGIRRRKFKIETPYLVRWAPLLKVLLPVSLFDWLAGRLFRIYSSMDNYRGRPAKSTRGKEE